MKNVYLTEDYEMKKLSELKAVPLYSYEELKNHPKYRNSVKKEISDYAIINPTSDEWGFILLGDGKVGLYGDDEFILATYELEAKIKRMVELEKERDELKKELFYIFN